MPAPPTRRRSIRHLDVAVTLYYYLMFINVAGVHAYAAIGNNPKHLAPNAAAMVQEARAQVQQYQAQAPKRAAPPSIAEYRKHLGGRGQGLLQRLDRLDKDVFSAKSDAAKWDEAIYVAEELRRAGDVLITASKQPKKKRDLTQGQLRVGVSVALRGAKTQARIAELLNNVRGGGPRRYHFPSAPPPPGQPNNIANGSLNDRLRAAEPGVSLRKSAKKRRRLEISERTRRKIIDGLRGDRAPIRR